MRGRTVLFDEPGPRARRRIRWATLAGGVILAVLTALAVRQFARQGQLAPEKWTPFTTWPVWRYLLHGLGSTLRAAAVCAVLGLILATILALGRLSRRRWLRWPAAAYVEIMRSVPVLLLVYVVLFGLPRYGIDLPVFWKLVAPLTVSSAAGTAEVIRAGVLSLPRGQAEAGLALGLTQGQVMRTVVLPQAFRRVLPSLVSQAVGLLKDTALGFVVSYAELLSSGRNLATYNRLLIQTYLVIAAGYLVINASLSKLARYLEARRA